MEGVFQNVRADLLSELLNQTAKDDKLSLLAPAVFLNVISKAIPTQKLLQWNIPHRPDGMAICFVVKDEGRADTEATTNAFKLKLIRECKAAGISVKSLPSITFMPLRELMFSYQTFEAKKRLHSTFDMFLIDARIAHRVSNKFGTVFYNGVTSKFPVPCDIQKKGFLKALQRSIHTQMVVVRGCGTSSSQHVGFSDMDPEELTENIHSLIRLIFEKWPSTIDNVRSMYLQCGTKSVPLYYSKSEAPIENVCENLKSATEACKAQKRLRLSKTKRISVLSTQRTEKLFKLAKKRPELKREAKAYNKLVENLKTAKTSSALRGLPEGLLDSIRAELPPSNAGVTKPKKRKSNN